MTPTPNERSTRVSSRDASTARWVGSAGAGAVAAAGAVPGTMGLRCLAGCATSSRWPPRKSALPDSPADLHGEARAGRSARRRWPRRSGREGWTIWHCSRPQAAAQAGEGAREGAEARSGASARLASRLATAAAAEAPAMGGDPRRREAGADVRKRGRVDDHEDPRESETREEERLLRVGRRRGGLRRLRGRQPKTTLVRERKSEKRRYGAPLSAPRESRRSGSRRG